MEMSCLSSGVQRFVSICIQNPHEKQHAVVPVFMPFRGCTHKCIFCAQYAQTGILPEKGNTVYEFLNTVMDNIKCNREEIEIAFYGGTFTSMPQEEQLLCIKTARLKCSNCSSVRIRCSTRPDALQAEWLQALHSAGLSMIEIGVQSFDDCALQTSVRGYTGAQARQACSLVRTAGLACGVQLLPGMPGHTPEMFIQDVATAIELGADCMRWYPCMVLEGTPLAELWRSEKFHTWDLETTIFALATAMCLAWEAQVPVIRIGLAPGPELMAAMLAGPWHPALGSLVRAEALLQLVTRHQRPGERLASLALPRRAQGFVGGEHGALWPRWAELGINPRTIRWHDGPDAILGYLSEDCAH